MRFGMHILFSQLTNIQECYIYREIVVLNILKRNSKSTNQINKTGKPSILSESQLA